MKKLVADAAFGSYVEAVTELTPDGAHIEDLYDPEPIPECVI